MIIQPPPKEDKASILKWLQSIFEFGKKPETLGDIIIDNSDKGLVLKDTAGVYWRITVSTAGTVTTTSLDTTKP